MPVDDRNRLDLHRKLETVLGQHDADTLMAHLPPVTWNEVATKDDVRAQTVLLRTEIEAMGAQLRTEIEATRTQLRTETHSLGNQLRAEFVEQMNRQIKWLVTFAAAWTSVLVTLVRFIP